MVKRSGNGDLGGLWLERRGLTEGSEVLGLFSRVRRAAPSLQIQSVEPVEASYVLAKTATLTMLRCCRSRFSDASSRTPPPPPCQTSGAPAGVS